MKVSISIERKRGLRYIVALSLCSVLITGCGSASTTPSLVATSVVIDTDKTLPEAPAQGGGPAINGLYPSFSGPLRAAGPQMSDEEAQKITLEMDALAKRRRAGSVSATEYAKRVVELQTLARNHGVDTVKEIEK